MDWTMITRVVPPRVTDRMIASILEAVTAFYDGAILIMTDRIRGTRPQTKRKRIHVEGKENKKKKQNIQQTGFPRSVWQSIRKEQGKGRPLKRTSGRSLESSSSTKSHTTIL